jgi:hypothetical protein
MNDSDYRTRDSLVGAIEVVCSGRGTHPVKALDQVLRGGVRRWTLASGAGVNRGRRAGGFHRPAVHTFDRATTEDVPGSIAPVHVDDTTTFVCPVRQCRKTLSLRGNNFQAKFDQLETAGVSVLDLSLI